MSITKSKYCLLTNDVETTSIWLNTLRDETGWKVYREGMPLLLDLYDKYDIKCSFFFTGYIARLIPDIVRITAARGHEICNHGLSHKKDKGFDVMPFEKQKEHMLEAKKILEDITGEEITTFRAPSLRTNRYTARALIETGHKIDSSVASQRFDLFLSFGSMRKINWMFAPRLPYHVDPSSLFKKGNSALIEIPLSATLMPYVGTTMRVFPNLSKMQHSILHFENKRNGKPIVFDIHPNEFIDESGEKRIIYRRSVNPITYFLKDIVRSRIKVKNLGPAGIPIYEREILFFKEKGYAFTTLRDYSFKTGLMV